MSRATVAGTFVVFFLLSACSGRTTREGSAVRGIASHDQISSIAVSSSKNVLAAGTETGQVLLWDLGTGKALWSRSGYGHEIVRLFVRDKDVIAVERAGAIRELDLVSGEKLASYQPMIGDEGVESAAFDDLGTKVLLGDDRGDVYSVDLDAALAYGKVSLNDPDPKSKVPQVPLYPYENVGPAEAVTFDGNLAIAVMPGEVYAWQPTVQDDLIRPRYLRKLGSADWKDSLFGVACAQDLCMTTGYLNKYGEMQLWQGSTLRMLEDTTTPGGMAVGAAISSDGQHAVVLGELGYFFFDIVGQTLKPRFWVHSLVTDPRAYVSTISFITNNQVAVAAQRSIIIYDVTSFKRLAVLGDPNPDVQERAPPKVVTNFPR